MRIGLPLLALIAGLLTAGCDPALAPAPPGPRVTQVELAGGAIRLTAPAGYCIDPKSLNTNRGSRFAMLARCDRLAGGFSTGAPAVITVSTVPHRTNVPLPDIEVLVAAAAPAKTLETRERDGIPIVRLESRRPHLPGTDAEHWRASVAAGGHLVALAFYAPKNSPALKSGGDTLLRLARRIRRENPVPAE